MQRTDLITLKQKFNCSISILTKPLPKKKRERERDIHRETHTERKRGRDAEGGKKPHFLLQSPSLGEEPFLVGEPGLGEGDWFWLKKIPECCKVQAKGCKKIRSNTD